MKNNLKIVAVSFALISALLLGISGCHTAEGFGQDLESGGKAIQKSASGNNASDSTSSSSETTTTTTSSTSY
jgi:predicted small secreted protein